MSNPFEDAEVGYQVIVNDEGQHSLWPADLRIPDGWNMVHEADSRSHCIDYIEENWTDLRPRSLIQEEPV